MSIAMMMMVGRSVGGQERNRKIERKILFQHSSASIYYYIVALKCTFKGLCKLFSLIRIRIRILVLVLVLALVGII